MQLAMAKPAIKVSLASNYNVGAVLGPAVKPIGEGPVTDVDAAVAGTALAAGAGVVTAGKIRRIVDGLAAVKENRVGHCRVVDAGDMVLALESYIVCAAGSYEVTATGITGTGRGTFDDVAVGNCVQGSFGAAAFNYADGTGGLDALCR